MKTVEEIIAGALKIPQAAVREDMEYQSIPEWDSLGHIDLMLAIEAETGAEISADMMVELISVKAIRKYFGDRRGGTQ